jgi:hypothetical protein
MFSFDRRTSTARAKEQSTGGDLQHLIYAALEALKACRRTSHGTNRTMVLHYQVNPDLRPIEE